MNCPGGSCEYVAAVEHPKARSLNSYGAQTEHPRRESPGDGHLSEILWRNEKKP